VEEEKMQLSEPEIDRFYRLYYSLLIDVNQRINGFEQLRELEDLVDFTIAEIEILRQQLYQHPELFDRFLEENPRDFSSEDLNLVRSWKTFIKGKFYIFGYREQYTLFLVDRKPSKVYGVLALDIPFRELIGSALPAIVETVLLPFGDRIIYDGILQSYPFYFGCSIRGTLQDSYQEAESKFGIITRLDEPVRQKTEEYRPQAEIAAMSDEALIDYYIEHEGDRDRYREQLETAIANNTKLAKQYYQKIGQYSADRAAKNYKKIGIKKAWIAFYEETAIATGTTKAELEGILKKLLSVQKRKNVYIYRLK
jgi:hypothetical protein